MGRRGRQVLGALVTALVTVATALAAATPAAAAGGKIRNVGTGKCLTVAGGSTAPSAVATQFRCDDHPSRLWRVEGRLDTTFQLVNDHSGLCLMPRSGGLLALVDQYPCTAHPNRSWRLVDTPSPGAMLQNVATGLCLTPDAGSFADNVAMVAWHCDNHPTRNWYAH